MAFDKDVGTLRQRPSYSITRRRGNILSLNVNESDPSGRKFLERLKFAAKASLKRNLNKDMVHLLLDLNELLLVPEETATEP